MQLIPDKSIDMICCDLPYGTTNNFWDIIIPFDKLWPQYERIVKDDAAIVLFASGIFAAQLVQSNFPLFRYKWIWVKNNATDFVNAKTRPMRKFEEVLVFSKRAAVNSSKAKNMKYYPQGLVRINKKFQHGQNTSKSEYVKIKQKSYIQEFENYPTDILIFNRVEKERIHPSQKPLKLIEYLIKTYTKEGEVVLDNCMGSGTTAIACLNVNRQFIGFEMDETYHKNALKRIEQNVTQLELFE
ncbi:MAG: site-specific DNA-methyltransferase [Streptococcaceae bacterium]|nr:site-specific DNA-methyltransferase [Streptococcaceae bacterium]